MPRHRVLPPLDELRAELAAQGVTDAPTEGDPDALQGLLDVALYVAEHRKRVSFPAFSWDDPAFEARDQKVTMRVAYLRLARGDDLAGALRAHVGRVATGHALLALDARASGLREFEILHQLYGRVTLFEHRTPVPESADLRIEEARERGWAKTLKEHNLLPGRSLVVLDEHQGHLLREPSLTALMGILLLSPDGIVSLLWNPFVEADRNDAELQYWLGWGEGSGRSSEWREVVRYEGE